LSAAGMMRHLPHAIAVTVAMIVIKVVRTILFISLIV